MNFSQTSFLLILRFCTFSDALTPDNCKISTTQHKNGKYTLELTASDPEYVKTTIFEIDNVKITLDLHKITYVTITVPNVDEMDCAFVGQNVVITHKLSAETVPIDIARGKSAEIFFGTKTVKIKHDNRNVVPFNVQVKSNTATTATLTLKVAGSNPKVNLIMEASNLLVVPKAAFDSLDVELELGADGHVIVDNFQDEKATLALGQNCALTCLVQKCSVEVEKGTDVLLRVSLADKPRLDNPKLLVKAKKGEEIVLEDGVVDVVSELKNEMNDDLELEFTSNLNDITKPPVVYIYNFDLKKDKLLLKEPIVILHGKPMTGTFKFDKPTTLKLKLLKDSAAKRSNVGFSINNPYAQRPIDLTQRAQLSPNVNEVTLHFFKDQLSSTLPSEFYVKNHADKRIVLKIERSDLEVKLIEPGIKGKLSYQVNAYIRKPLNDKNITLVLKLHPDSKVEKAMFKVGTKEIEFTKTQKYYYIYQDRFQDTLGLNCSVQTQGAELEYTRIDQIFQMRIRKGKKTILQPGNFVLIIDDPARGATISIKEEKNKIMYIHFDLDLNRKVNGEVMKLNRHINGAYEEIIFIYPEDLSGVKELKGSLKFGEGVSLEIDNTPGIDVLRMTSGNYIVRNNTVKLGVRNPNTENVVLLELKNDSQANLVVFEIDNTKHEVKKHGNVVAVTLTKEYLAKNPSPFATFISEPSDLDAHVNVHIKTSTVKCEPNPCLNKGTCEKKGDGFKCICAKEFKGLLCADEATTTTPASTSDLKGAATDIQHSIFVVMATLVLAFLCISN